MDTPFIFVQRVPTEGLRLAPEPVGCSSARGCGATTPVWPRGPPGGIRSHAGHREEDNIIRRIIKWLAHITTANWSMKKPGSVSSTEATLLPSSRSGNSSPSNGDSGSVPEGDWTNNGEALMGIDKVPRLGSHTPKH